MWVTISSRHDRNTTMHSLEFDLLSVKKYLLTLLLLALVMEKNLCSTFTRY